MLIHELGRRFRINRHRQGPLKNLVDGDGPMRALFPDAVLGRERICALTKSFVACRPPPRPA